MIDDVRYAFRQFRKQPGFAALAVLTLALGVGSTAAMFGVIQGVLLTPPPYAEPGRLVLMAPARIDGQPYDQRPTTALRTAWRASSRALAETAYYRWTFNFLVLPDGSQSLGGMVVTTNYFRVLGLEPLIGRVFVDSEAARPPNTPPTAVILGYDVWMRRFNGDRAILGKPIQISRQPAPLPVVGVMPPGVRFLPDPGTASEPNYDVDAPVDFWLAAVPDESQPRARAWNTISRLRPGATTTQAEAEVTAIAAAQGRTDADLEGLTARVRSVPDTLNHEGRRLLMPLLASVALVFLIACGNVAALLLAQGLRRQQEYAMRAALGAGRWRLFRQVLTETTVLALVSALAGAGVAVAMVGPLKAIGGHAIPRVDTVAVGWPVFAFGALAALLASALAGLLPAARASRSDRFHALESGRTGQGRAEHRLLAGVATVQVVLTVALLAGAALLLRTAHNLSSVRPGFETDRILAMTVTSVQPDRWRDFHTQALARVSRLPAVTHAAFVWGLPLTGNKWSGDVEIPGQPRTSKIADRVNLPLRAVTPGYFDAMGIAIVGGRGFRDADDAGAPGVALINRTFARRYFGDTTPIGRSLRFAGSDRAIEIVGIVSDTRTEALSEQAEPEMYFCLWQSRAFSKHLILRTAADPRALAGLVTRELRAVEPTAAVERVTTMADIRAESVAPRTFAMHLLSGFAATATLLALVGLYGVMALSVGARTREMAVRRAIGAQRHEIGRLVLGQGSRFVAVGIVLGAVLALILGHTLRALLFGVEPADPLALAGAAVVFGLVALAACGPPAWRAARVDLMEALRHD